MSLCSAPSGWVPPPDPSEAGKKKKGGKKGGKGGGSEGQEAPAAQDGNVAQAPAELDPEKAAKKVGAQRNAAAV